MPEYADSSVSGDSLLYTFDVNGEGTLVESGERAMEQVFTLTEVLI